MKDVNKICTVAAICFFLWQLNNIFQLSYKRIKLDECVQKVNVDYEKNWDNACKIAGKKPNCTLSVFQSQTVEEIRKHSLNMCVEIFKYNN